MYYERRNEIIMAVIIMIVLIVVCNYYENPNESILEEPEETNTQYSGSMGEFIPIEGTGFEQSQETEMSTTTECTVAYVLTNEERDLIERVVMGSAGCESVKGQKAVAQCILNACYIMNERPNYVIEALQYTEYRPNPSDEVKQSVSAVFDKGEKVFGEKVIYFYNRSETNYYWHETQKYVCTIGSHRFFEEKYYYED